MRQRDHSHEPSDIADRLAQGFRPSYLRDWVNGGIDGTVTTFAVVAGVAGADLSGSIVLILGAANLVADGFSMAASNFSATRAEAQEAGNLRKMEERHIELFPEGEREEVRQILFARGFRDDELTRAVEITTATRETWINTMLSGEHGQPAFVRSPVYAGLFTFIAFVLCGFAPLLPYVMGYSASLAISAALSGLVFFSIGSMKSRWAGVNWFASGVETFAIGATAAGLAYLAGHVLKSLGQ